MSIQDSDERVIVNQKLAFERVFKSTDGQVVLAVLANKCIPDIGEYEPDPYRMAYNEGQRNMLMTILRTASIEMEDFLKKYEAIKRGETEWMTD
jgi:hypothetical protein